MQHEVLRTPEAPIQLLGIEDAAARLALSPWTVRLYVRQGKIASVKIGSRVLIESSEILRLIAEGTRPAVTQET